MEFMFFAAPAAKVARMLIILAVFGQVIFMTVADFIYQGFVTLQAAFGVTYVICATMQVCKQTFHTYLPLTLYPQGVAENLRYCSETPTFYQKFHHIKIYFLVLISIIRSVTLSENPCGTESNPIGDICLMIINE
jgi:hypothetical protein